MIPAAEQFTPMQNMIHFTYIFTPSREARPTQAKAAAS